MAKVLTEQQAQAVYQILVEVCGAPAHPRNERAFVAEYATESKFVPSMEWRFQGKLGYGGKFRYPRLSVDCYAEHETPALRAIMVEANAKLTALKATFGG